MSTLIALDIDNTLIYSRKHPHPGWPCVEWIHEEEQAYMSPRTAELYRELCGEPCVALVTSRSIEQYRRLRLPADAGLAVTANGADLLVNGITDPAWRREVDTLLEPWRDELLRRFDELKNSAQYIRCRVVDDAYTFVYCAEGVTPEAEVRHITESTTLDVMASGKKIYLLPPPLNKGAAIRRLMTYLGCERCIAAGDSAMDLPMLTAADVAIAPVTMKDLLPQGAMICPSDELFSEYVLKSVRRSINHLCKR